jgi:hypothetical protein
MGFMNNYVNNINRPCTYGIKNNKNFKYYNFKDYELYCDLLKHELNILEDIFKEKKKGSDGVYSTTKDYFFRSRKFDETTIYSAFYTSKYTERNDFSTELFEVELFLLLNDIKKLKTDFNNLMGNLENLLNKIFC